MTSLMLNRADGYTWHELLTILQCPICHNSFEFQNIDQGLPYAREYGVLNCGCNRYPVVDGVPIFIDGPIGAMEHTLGTVEYEGPSRDSLTNLVLAGKGLDALLRCVAFPLKIGLFERIRPRRLWRSRPFQQFMVNLRRGKLRKWCVMDRGALTAQDWFDVFFRQYSPVEGDMFNYFFYRFTQPRYLAALRLVSSLPVHEKAPPRSSVRIRAHGAQSSRVACKALRGWSRPEFLPSLDGPILDRAKEPLRMRGCQSATPIYR